MHHWAYVSCGKVAISNSKQPVEVHSLWVREVFYICVSERDKRFESSWSAMCYRLEDIQAASHLHFAGTEQQTCYLYCTAAGAGCSEPGYTRKGILVMILGACMWWKCGCFGSRFRFHSGHTMGSSSRNRGWGMCYDLSSLYWKILFQN